MIYRALAAAAAYCRRRFGCRVILKWIILPLLCIFVLATLYYITYGDPVVNIVHSVASYSDGYRLRTVNRFTEEIFKDVINPYKFDFVIAEKDKCHVAEEIFLLVVIHSKATHVDLRIKQRQTTLSETIILGKRITVVYLIGNVTTTKAHDSRIVEESRKYRDIVMGNYKDTYYNLTYKFMMGMKWASAFCPEAKYVLKGDDDVYYNLHNIVEMLMLSPSRNFMAGYVHNYAKPYRNRASKWYIPEKVYPYEYYPPFCVGFAYVMSGDLPAKLFHVAQHIPFFPLDDVFAGFCARRLNVRPVYKVAFRRPGRGPLTFCNLNLSYAIHFSDYNQIPKMWGNNNPIAIITHVARLPTT